MRRVIATLAVLIEAMAIAVGAPTALADAVPVAAPSPAVSVELNRAAVSGRLGERFGFESTVRNDSDRPMSGVIAHLNVLSSDPGVYVDPEDWSARRTQYLDELPAHRSVRLTWTVQAVDSGPLILYVAAVRPGTDGVAASGPLTLTVEQRRTINAGGILPTAAAMPAVVLVLLALTVIRRRRFR
jgi:hypothetical protein